MTVPHPQVSAAGAGDRAALRPSPRGARAWAILRALVDDPRRAALAVLGLALVTIAGAWAFEMAGYPPCKLCLQQRLPYYAGLPVALTAFAIARREPLMARAGLSLIAILCGAGAALAGYHAGVEWGWWPGPQDCAVRPAAAGPAVVTDFLKDLQAAKVVSCSEAALRIAGLSLAGWNLVLSCAIAALAAAAALRDRTRVRP